MGSRGPAKTKRKTKRLRGTDRADRHAAAPKVETRTPPVPAWLSADAKAEWKRLAAGLHALGVLTTLDRAAFAVYCEAWASFRKARDAVRAHGLTSVTDKGNVVMHPAVAAMKQSADSLLKLAKEFGLTPKARSALSEMFDDDEGGGDPQAQEILGF